ncbi:MAG: SMP-30/gluconolactonase/LRE family protein [Bacteroidales bacterium]|jgi:sugar lactone lactonase YvrE|nr:SMP-30/gluconolactonase/LRE family protein [Bacteroidales bacterium]
MKRSLVFLFILPALFTFKSVSQTSSSGLYQSRILTPVNSFTIGVEGPAVDKNGVLYAVNYERQGTIGQVTPSGEASVFVELPEGSIGNGIRFDSHGNMLIADYTGHNILRVDMATREISIFAHEPLMSQPNDIAIDRKNRLYASDPDWKQRKGRFWRIDTDGRSVLLDSMGTVNGIEVSPNNKTLYVNSSRTVWAYDLSPKGEISRKRMLIEFPDFGMDGMRCDIKGNLYIARFGKGVVAVVSPEGKLLREIPLIGKRPTNVAFGGTDGKTLYVTMQDQGNIECFSVEIPGREWKMQKKQKPNKK